MNVRQMSGGRSGALATAARITRAAEWAGSVGETVRSAEHGVGVLDFAAMRQDFSRVFGLSCSASGNTTREA